MKPMGAKSVTDKKLTELLCNKNYIVQEKFTGIRAFITKTPSNFSIVTRGGHNITRLLPHLYILNKYNYNYSVFDCELCAPGMDDAQVAGLLNPHKVNIQDTSMVEAKIFDIIDYTENNLTLTQRLRKLELLKSLYLQQSIAPIEQITFIPFVSGDKEQKQAFIDKIFKEGKEGVIFKNLNAYYVYNSKPSNNWYKLKRVDTFDCFIIGYTKGKGKYTNLIGAVEIGQIDKNLNIRSIGTVSGFTDSIRYDITNKPNEYLYKVIEVAARERTKSGALKEPRFIRFRTDKNFSECVMET